MQPKPVSTARSPSFWPGPSSARPGPKVIGPGLARHGAAGRAWAALQARGQARPGPPNNNIYKITHFDI